MVFASPLKILERLLTTTSVYGSTSTLTKLPMVSSTTIRKSYLSARARSRGRSAQRRRGLEGNSVKRAKIGGVPGFSEDSRSRIRSSSSMSGSSPCPRKKQPGPHFSRILRVSVYGNLTKSQFSLILSRKRVKAYPKQMLLAGGRAPRASWWALQIADIPVG